MSLISKLVAFTLFIKALVCAYRGSAAIIIGLIKGLTKVTVVQSENVALTT